MSSPQLLDENYRIPKPPQFPSRNYGSHKNYMRKLGDCVDLYEKRKEAWDKVFMEGYGADVCVVTGKDGAHVAIGDDHVILAHSCILGMSSPVLRNMIEEAPVERNFRSINISGVTREAAQVFIRFLYSSRYEEEEMKNNAFHLLVLSHAYSVPSLKKLCIYQIEKRILNHDNVVDLLQLAMGCDAARLAFICTRFICKDFKTVSVTEGWKVMRAVNPSLEQELLEFLVESDSRKLEMSKRREEHKTYLLLYEAMEALVHICRDGCSNIGPANKSFNHIQNQGANCSFSACKTLELLVRHFRSCEVCVPGGCANCKRMWQLLELHSRMCTESYFCKVALCRYLLLFLKGGENPPISLQPRIILIPNNWRYFKEKMQNLSKKEEQKWDLLVSRVQASKGTLSSIRYRRPFYEEKIRVNWHDYF